VLNLLFGLLANLFISFSFGPLSGEVKMSYEIWAAPKGETETKLYSKSANMQIAQAVVKSLVKTGVKAEVKGPFVETSIKFDPKKNEKPTFGVNGNVNVGLPGGPGVTISGSAGTGQKPTWSVTPSAGPTAPTGGSKPTAGSTPKPTTGSTTTGSPAPKPTTGSTTGGSTTGSTSPKPTTPPAATEDDAPWMAIARKEIGTKEVTGSKHNPRILEYHQATSLKAKDDETAWCSSFANWVMAQAGVEGTNRANARSWLDWGKKIEKPVPGAVVVFWRNSPTSWEGHVGFYVGEEGNNVLVLGGNQSNGVNVAKYPKSQLLGYRMP
jgi:uncharacterized protein (TIGR02594 family)